MEVSLRAPLRVDFAGGWTDVSLYAEEHGGATLNAAIALYVTGYLRSREDEASLEYHANVPPGSGLGASSAQNVVWLALVQGRIPASRQERIMLAEQSYKLEGLLGIMGGKQDSYAAALGGCNFYRFRGGTARVQCLPLGPDLRHELEARLLLCYSGRGHVSSCLHEGVWRAYRRGNRRVLHALHDLRDGAVAAASCLRAGDVDGLGRMLEQQHAAACTLHPALTTPEIEDLRTLLQPWMLGAKCCGAGGGGCVLFLARDAGARRRAERELRQRNVPTLPVRLDLQGLNTVRVA